MMLIGNNCHHYNMCDYSAVTIIIGDSQLSKLLPVIGIYHVYFSSGTGQSKSLILTK